MRLKTTFYLLAIGLAMMGVSLRPAAAQSTVSDQPWEFTAATGFWGAFLPGYEYGANTTSGGPAFQDDLEDLGTFSELKLVRRFLGTRTSFETKAFYAFAEESWDGSTYDISVPAPSTGAANPFAGSRPRLDSEVDHYGFDVALRDTWRTSMGGLSAGCAFSWLTFDQDFAAAYGGAGLLREQLDSDLRGGKAIFGWDGCFRGRPSMLDFGIGFYDMNVDYRFADAFTPATGAVEFSRDSTTVETNFTTRTNFRGYQVGLRMGAMYISDLPVIRHEELAPATLDTDDAVTLTGMVEILL